MAETAPGREFRNVLSNLGADSRYESVFEASGVDADHCSSAGACPTYAPDGSLLHEPEITRHVAVFREHASWDYVVITDDGTGAAVRSWTAANEAVEDRRADEYFIIPGCTERDELIIPVLGAAVVGGIGATPLEMNEAQRLFGQGSSAIDGL